MNDDHKEEAEQSEKEKSTEEKKQEEQETMPDSDSDHKEEAEQSEEEKSTEEKEQEEQEAMPDSESDHTELPTLHVGLIPAPKAASDLSDKLAGELSDLLRDYVDDEYSWKVEIVVDSYIGAEEDASKTLQQAQSISDDKDWDYAIAVTDMPLFKDGEFIVAEVEEELALAQISLPALGFAPLLRRVREASLQLVSEMHHGSSEDARDKEQERINNMEPGNDKNMHKIGSRELCKGGPLNRFAPIKRITVDEEDADTTVRFVAAPRANGYMRLTSGMVRANDPYKVITTFKSVVAVAFATGAYALIFPTVWMLADSYDEIRAATLMVISFTAMTAWIIIAHKLWETRSETNDNKYLIRLHNASTVFTIAFGVAIYYILLFFCFLFAVFLFIPPDLLESGDGIGRPAGLPYFLYLAWLITSIATVIGAIGA
ncbi:MAG: hypothetical protein EA344_13325, partial [Alkalicoccus sp.]